MDRMASRRKLLVHFTDGDPDSVYHVETAVRECRKAGLAVRCIALAGIGPSLLDTSTAGATGSLSNRCRT
jgi:nitric oxide reductase activation protein